MFQLWGQADCFFDEFEIPIYDKCYCFTDNPLRNSIKFGPFHSPNRRRPGSPVYECHIPKIFAHLQYINISASLLDEHGAIPHNEEHMAKISFFHDAGIFLRYEYLYTVYQSLDFGEF